MKRIGLFFLVVALLVFLTACGLFSSSTQFFSRLGSKPGLDPEPRFEPKLILPTVTPNPLPTRVEDEKPTAAPAPSPLPQSSTLLDEYMPNRVKAAETEHYIIYTQDGFFPVDQEWWLDQVEEVYAYVSSRMQNAQVNEKILLGFLPPDQQACPVRGLASHDHPPVVIIYASFDSTSAYLLGVLAHETGHAISSEGFPGGMPDDLALTEGIATWASEKYWMKWIGAPSLDALVSEYLQQGTYESIRENYDLHGIYPWQKAGKDCLARRDKIYSEWASFLGYLIDHYGWEKAHRLFRLPSPEHHDGKIYHFPPDYEGIYGKSLNQLEQEWLRFIEEQFPQPPEPTIFLNPFIRHLTTS